MFNCHKFSYMIVKHNGSSVSVAGDSRITPLGAKLRHYKLDELPELWDVLIGNMSFVGQYNEDDSFHMQRHYEIVFEQRAIYMIYSAISKMKPKRRKVRAGDFESFMKKYTSGKNDEYIIIDTDCDLDILLDIDNRDTYGEWDYKGAEYKKIFLEAREYLRDVDLPIIFKNSLLILRKEDYPSLFKKNEDVMPQVIIADESDRDSGKAAVRVTVMPNLEMRYCNHC